MTTKNPQTLLQFLKSLGAKNIYADKRKYNYRIKIADNNSNFSLDKVDLIKQFNKNITVTVEKRQCVSPYFKRNFIIIRSLDSAGQTFQS